jgi:hypothetical protein
MMNSRSENIIIEAEDGTTLYQTEFKPISIVTPGPGEFVIVPDDGSRSIARSQDRGWSGGREMQIVSRKIALHPQGSFSHVLTVRVPAPAKKKPVRSAPWRPSGDAPIPAGRVSVGHMTTESETEEE